MNLRKILATALLSTAAVTAVVTVQSTSASSAGSSSQPVESAAPRHAALSSSTGERSHEVDNGVALDRSDHSGMADRFADLMARLDSSTSVTAPSADRHSSGSVSADVDRSRAADRRDDAVSVAGLGGSADELLHAPIDLADNGVGDASPDFNPGSAIDRSNGTARMLYAGEPYFSVTNQGYLGQQSLPPQVGRVFGFGKDAAGRWKLTTPCSGTLVAADLVLTAAHCIVGQSGWTFYPGLYGDSAPYGYWASTFASYDSGYTTSSEKWAFDYGFVKLQANTAGQLPSHIMNPFPVLTESTQVPNLTIVSEGYPVEGWWESNGNCNWNVHCYPWFCESSRAQVFDHGAGYRSMGWGCVSNGGISGGPVFGQYNGKWYVVSVHSTGGYLFNQASQTINTRPAWYMMNSWGPELRQDRFHQVAAAAG